MISRALTAAMAIASALHFTSSAPAAEGRQLTAGDLRESLVGRVGMMRFKMRSTSGRSIFRGIFYMHFRPDGSMRVKCEYYDVRSAAWALCTGRSKYGWYNGLWSFRGNSLCTITTTLEHPNSEPVCFAYYKDGAKFLIRKVSGPPRNYDNLGPFEVTVVKTDRPECLGYFKPANC